jgi:hypothetical protein
MLECANSGSNPRGMVEKTAAPYAKMEFIFAQRMARQTELGASQSHTN